MQYYRVGSPLRDGSGAVAKAAGNAMLVACVLVLSGGCEADPVEPGGREGATTTEEFPGPRESPSHHTQELNITFGHTPHSDLLRVCLDVILK